MQLTCRATFYILGDSPNPTQCLRPHPTKDAGKSPAPVIQGPWAISGPSWASLALSLEHLSRLWEKDTCSSQGPTPTPSFSPVRVPRARQQGQEPAALLAEAGEDSHCLSVSGPLGWGPGPWLSAECLMQITWKSKGV